ERLAEQTTAFAFEVVVVDDGSTDGSADVARSFAARTPLAVTVLEQPNSGPATARNRGIAAARTRVCLFLGDDTWPRPDLVDRHCAFHRRRPETEAALLGLVVWAAECGPSPFMEWLGSHGIQFDFAQIRDHERLPGSFFYTSNVSVKTELARAHGGFYERFRAAACEDIDLGLRLERAGMQLAFDPVAIVEHFHPTELLVTFEHVRASATGAGCSSNAIPGPFPRRPGSRHQLKGRR
nr:glycosyltransferase [Actinomycetota bacterium]